MLAVLVLLGAVTPVMAMPMPETFADGWYDGYNNWVYYGKNREQQRADDDSSHSDLYYQGFDTGLKYAREHVKVIIVQGHVLTDLNATAYITGWRDGQATRMDGLPRGPVIGSPFDYDKGFYAGFDAPQDTLPPGVDGYQTSLHYNYPRLNVPSPEVYECKYCEKLGP
jgi:hypothetical protein